MKSQEEIRKMFERSIRLFARTGSDKFLTELMLLQEILEVSSEETERLLLDYQKELEVK